MSAAKAEGSDGAPAGGITTKKLVVILAVAMALMAVGVGAAVMVVTKRAAAHADQQDEEPAEHEPVKKKKAKKAVNEHPVFLPLDPFVVNLTDREQDRYAQIGVTLEIADPKVGEEMKTYMPAIRNGILMVLAHKSSKELLAREGKETLAEEIRREAIRPLGYDDEDDGPVRAVHFANFIIQ